MFEAIDILQFQLSFQFLKVFKCALEIFNDIIGQHVG